MEEGRSRELNYYGTVLRRRWRVVLSCLLLGVLASAGYLMLTSKTYTATATVNVNVISTQPFTTEKPASQLLDPETEIQVATSSQVLGTAAKTLANNKTLTQMRATTAVQPVAGATVFQIRYTAPDKTTAVDGADAIATAFLDYRAAAASSKVNGVLDRLSAQRDHLSNKLVGANRRLDNSVKGSPVAVQAETDRELLDIQLTALVAQINQLDSVDTSGGTLLSGAHESAVKVSPSPLLIIGAGTMLGLIVGAVLAFAFNAVDRRVADSQTLSSLGGGEILAQLTGRHAAVPAEGRDLDQIRGLRERLLARIGPGGNLVVIDLAVRDRPADIAVNLTLAMVERGGFVRLVLPDHSEENLHVLARTLDLQPIEGSSDGWSYTSGLASGLEVVFTREDQRLGAPGARLGSILSEAHHPDLTTLVAMPPKASRSLWLTAGRLGHSIILVASRRETRVSAVRQLVNELGAVGAVIHGSVLVPRRRTVEMKAAEEVRPPPSHALDDEASVAEVPRSKPSGVPADDGAAETVVSEEDVRGLGETSSGDASGTRGVTSGWFQP
jgi:capsular polysaccharide biosynthesis protein